jgi:hypothetical protein
MKKFAAMQPLLKRVRQTGSQPQETPFQELQRHGRFAETCGEIFEPHAVQSYSDRLVVAAKALGICCIDLHPGR